MSQARLLITAVLLEGRTKSEVARDYGVLPVLGADPGQTLPRRRRCRLPAPVPTPPDRSGGC